MKNKVPKEDRDPALTDEDRELFEDLKRYQNELGIGFYNNKKYENVDEALVKSHQELKLIILQYEGKMLPDGFEILDPEDYRTDDLCLN